MRTPLLLALGVSALLATPAAAQTQLTETFELPGDAEVPKVQLHLNLPAGHDPAQRYPVILALPPGPGTAPMVEAGLARYWRQEASRRGYLVVSVELHGRRFKGRAGKLVRGALALAQRHGGDRQRVVLAGFSNGGLAAFTTLLETWEHRPFRGLIGLPGALALDQSVAELDMSGFPVLLLVGEGDGLWVVGVERTAQALLERGALVAKQVLEGQGHVIEIAPGRLFDWIDGVVER